MGLSPFFEKVRGIFEMPIETCRLALLSPTHAGAEKITDLLNAEGGDFYTHTTGQDYQARKNPVGLKYIQNTILPFFEQGQGVDHFKVFIAEKLSMQLIGTLTVWEDTGQRTRLSPYMLPSKRAKGLTREAYDGVVTVCDAHGMFGALHEVWAEVSVKNGASIAFYKAMGFEERGIINTPAPRLPSEWQERYALCKELN